MSMCDYCINNGACNQPYWKQSGVKKYELYCDSFKVFRMPRISMNRTTSAFVTENKEVTRRHWQPVTIKRFKKDTKFLAVQRCYGGEALGVGRLTEDTLKQPTGKMESKEYFDEGFKHLDDEYSRITENNLISGHPLIIAFERWIDKNQILTVIPFKVIEVFPGIKEKYSTDEEIIRCVKALVRAIG